MKRSDQFEQICDIADAIFSNTATEEQLDMLDKLLVGNPDAQQFYYDYINVHLQMLPEAGPSMEVVRRRLQVDEVIFRPSTKQDDYVDNTHLINACGAQPAMAHNSKPQQAALPPTNNKKWLVLFTLLIALLITLIALVLFNTDKADHFGELLSEGTLHISGQGKIEAALVYPGLYLTSDKTALVLADDELLVLEKNTLVKLYNTAEIEIMRGKLSLDRASGRNLIFNAPNFSIHSQGSDLSIDLTNKQPRVLTSQQSSLLPKRWQPNHYWPFEGTSDRVIDYAGNAFGIPDSGTTKVNGLVGSGAFSFDNGSQARINVGSGGGTAPATGSFSVIDGVTIEALVIPHFNPQLTADAWLGEQDQIFRKDREDKAHRMLLSFQNGTTNDFLRPKGIVGESIAFGMYLVGQGYHTLRLPLDGKDGRPTLAQLKNGQAHHIIGNYDVRTGLKAIYVDGQLKASYQYPPGTKMLSGGSGTANIGNSPNRTDAKEAFAGIIDEVAFYDFALPAYTIEQHYQATQQGTNYFNLDLSAQKLPNKISMPLPANSVISLDPLTGLISSTSIKK